MWQILFFIAIAGLLFLHFFWRGRLRRVEEQLRETRREVEEARTREQVLRSEITSQQEALLNSITEGILILDAGGRITTANQALVEMFDLPKLVAGRALLEVFRLHPLSELVAEIRRSGQTRELELAVPGIRPRHFEVNGATLRHVEGTGVILTFHEITRLKHLESMRKEFVANVSHELRTPLTLIKGFSETLLEGASQDPVHSHRFLTTIQRHADRLALIIDDLLTISHLESGEVTFEKQTLRLAPIVQRLAADLHDRASARGMKIENLVSTDVVVCADLQRLQQVLTNLLENAIKYGREDGRVTVAASALNKEGIEISVTDDGPGIPPNALERVFERFYRVDKARSREQGGTGLGLSIVKHIVQSHGGRVWAESELEKGSSFHFTLPAER